MLSLIPVLALLATANAVAIDRTGSQVEKRGCLGDPLGLIPGFCSTPSSSAKTTTATSTSTSKAATTTASTTSAALTTVNVVNTATSVAASIINCPLGVIINGVCSQTTASTSTSSAAVTTTAKTSTTSTSAPATTTTAGGVVSAVVGAPVAVVSQVLTCPLDPLGVLGICGSAASSSSAAAASSSAASASSSAAAASSSAAAASSSAAAASSSAAAASSSAAAASSSVAAASSSAAAAASSSAAAASSSAAAASSSAAAASSSVAAASSSAAAAASSSAAAASSSAAAASSSAAAASSSAAAASSSSAAAAAATAAPTNPVVAGWAYQAVVAEGTGGRALTGSTFAGSSMTVESCLAFCDNGGYPLAGLEYSSECYCGSSLSNGASLTKTATGGMTCSGNAKELCGGSSALSLYRSTKSNGAGLNTDLTSASVALPAGWSSTVCMQEVSGRAFTKKSLTGNDMTIQKCLSFCGDSKYAGLEYGSECYCADVLSNGASLTSTSGQCVTPCAGSASTTCGGPNALQVYTNANKQVSAGAYSNTGCVQEVDGRILRGASIAADNMSIETCTSFCQSQGFSIAGLEYGRECYCDNKYFSAPLQSGQCNMNCAGNANENCGGPNALNIFTLQ